MRKAKEHRDLKLAVSLALTAGLFAVPQISYGAPVLDPSSTRNANYVHVKQQDKVTDITGKQAHNVIDWKDFSINQGETVQFDHGEKMKDYLNLVTGDQPSTINGALKGGKDVYIVNPNGVVFGKGASVDVGNLYVSTTKATLDVSKYLASGASPLVNTAYQAAGAVTNLGKISADRVEVEGGNIKFLSTGDVTDAKGAINKNVQLTTSTGTIQIGHDAGDQTTYTTLRASDTSTVTVPENYTTIKTLLDLQNMTTGDSTVKYWLYNNIDASGGSYTPVGAKNDTAFQGTFEGNFFTVSNLNVSNVTYGGLFGRTCGAIIKDVGVKGGSISANTKTGAAGGIVGLAEDTTLTNVFNNGTTVRASRQVGFGGIVGQTRGTVNINTVYNTGDYGDHGAAIVGCIFSGNTNITNAYNTSTQDQGKGALVASSKSGTALTISNAYTVGDVAYTTFIQETPKVTNFVAKASSKSKSDYTGLSGVSDSGTDNTVWRIYEGKTMPLLRAFLRGNANGGTVTVNYDYDMGKDSDGTLVTGSNGGTDLKKMYNANDLVLSNITYTGSNGGVIDTSKIQTDSTKLHDANVYTEGSTTSSGVDYFYTGQDGYDLVGNHISINQREVDLTNALNTSAILKKEYDGTNKVNQDDIQRLFEASKGTGLIHGDTTASFSTDGLTGTFNDASVGRGKTVTLDGGVKLVNAAGHHNYKISNGSTSFSNQTLKGIITPRVLTVTTDKTYTKVYDKKSDIGSTPAEADFTLNGDIVSGEHVEFSLLNPTGTFGDGTGDAFTDNVNAGSRTVKLSGLSLRGDNAKNYILEDSNKNVLYSAEFDADANDVGGIHTDSGGSLFTTGTITKRNILSTGFSWYKDGTKQTASREYDGTSAYTDPVNYEVRSDTQGRSGDTGMLDGDSLTFTVKSAKFVTDATNASSSDAKDVSTAKGVAYTVTVSGDAAANYTLGGADITAGQTNTVVGEGSITPRTIKLVANAAKTASKVYDGDAIVKDSTDATKGTDSNPFTLSDGYLTYADADDESHHLVNGDGSTLTYTGVYEKTGSETAAKDVNYVNGAVQNKNITYTALVKDSSGNASSNYVFETSGGSTTQTYQGTGVITPRTIKNLTFADVSKVYDGDATVDSSKISVTGADGLVSGEKIQDILASNAQNNLTARYGSGTTDATFTANEHVVNGGAAGSKDVQYTGIQSVFGNNHNYTLDSSIGDTLYGKGTITPLTITDRTKLTLEKTKNFTKVYDGTTSVANGSTKAQAYIGALTYTTDTNKTVTLGDADGGYTIESADYASKNSQNGAAQHVTYALKVGGTGQYTGDYTLARTLLDSRGNLAWGSVDADSKQTKGVSGASDGLTGVITKRNVMSSLGIGNVEKIYDGSTSVKVNGSPIQATQAISMEAQNDSTQTGWITTDAKDYTVAAKYDNKNAGTGKTVTYAITLAGDSAGNYNLVDANGQTLSNNTLTGSGTIDKAPLTIAFGDVTKVYDGTADVVGKIDKSTKGDKQGVITPVYKGIQTDASTNALDDVKLTGDDAASGYSAYQAAFNSPDVKDASQVTYTVALTGADAGNYYLANAQGSGIGQLNTVTLADGTTQQTIAGKGKIYAKTIKDSDIAVNFANTISKVYDAKDDVTYDHTGDTRYFRDEKGKADAGDYVQSITIDGQTLSKGDYTIDSAKYNSVGIDASKATYTFDLAGSARSNYDLSGLTNKALSGNAYGFQDTKTSGVSITPKKVKAALADTSLMEKVYNAKTDLVVNSQADTTGTAIDTSKKVTLSGLVNDNGDTAALDTSKLNGRFQDADVAYVAYDSSNLVTTKDVLFDVALMGNGAGNYTIVDATDAANAAASANHGSITLTGADLGKITPKVLTADFTIAERNYNAKADIELDPDPTNKDKATTVTVTADGLQGTDTLTLKKSDIQGKYGTGTEENFTEDANVNYGESYIDKAGYKAVKYTNLQQALADATPGSNTKIKNYTIADTAYFAEAAKKGRIKRLALTEGDIEESWNLPITKVYDGTDKVLAANGSDSLTDPDAVKKYFSIHTKADGTSHLGIEVPIDYTLSKAVYDNSQKNVGQNLGVTFTVDGLAGKEFHNFVMPDSITTKYSGTFHHTGSITPRVLSIDLSKKMGWVKTYDTTTALKNDDGSEANLTLGNGYVWHTNADGTVTGDILSADTGTVKLAVTAAYGDEKADIAPEGKDGSALANGKSISYTMTLTGNDAGNYTLDASNTTNGAAAETKTVADAATGDIRQKIVKAGWSSDAPTGIDKVYDGTADVDSSYLTQYKNQVQLDNMAILTSDQGKVSLNLGKFTAQYVDKDGKADANVSRDENGKVQTKTVQFSASLPSLTGDRAENYYLETSDLKGTGTISPKNIAVDLKPGVITKVYDGNTAISDTYLNPDNVLTIHAVGDASADGLESQDGVKDKLHVGITSGSYASRHVVDNQGTGTVSYGLNWDNGNYNLVTDSSSGKMGTFSKDGNALAVTLSDHVGRITPRELQVDFQKMKDWIKTYDGNTSLERDGAVVSALTEGSDYTWKENHGILAGDQAQLTITGAYADKNANISPTTDAVNGKNVSYTLSLAQDGNGDYTLGTNGDNTSYAAMGAASEVDAKTYADAAKGDIRQRRVFVDFTEMPQGISKVYDGSAAVTEANGSLSKWQKYVAALSGDTDTGFVQGDDAALDTGAIAVNFSDADVARDSAKRVTTKEAYFSNFQAEGSDAANYALSVKDDKTLSAVGTITPKTVQVSIKDTPTKEYDGTTAVAPSQASTRNIAWDSRMLVGNDTLNVSLQSGKAPSYDNAHSNQTNGGKGIGVNYYLTWDNGNYELVHTASGSGDTQTMTTDGQNGTLRTKSGIITPRTLTIDSVADVTKVYDGTRTVDNTVVSQTQDADGVYHDGDELNHSTAKITIGRIVNGDDVGFTASGQYDNPYAASSESQDTQEHEVTYNLAITNTDYQLESSTVSGKGYITRRGLTVQAVPADIYAGQDMPSFTGTVTGWLKGESDGSGDFVFRAYTDATDADGNAETVPLASTQVPGSYAVYGAYNGRFSGNYGQNYRFGQAPANATAFEIQYIPDKPYRETINPSHHPASGGGISVPKSQNVGTDFVKTAQANIAYPTHNGAAAVNLSNDSDTSTSSAYRAYTQQGGTTIGTMEIINADVVNLDSSRRVDLDDSTASVQQAAGSRAGNVEIQSTDNGATLTITNDFPDVFEADNNVSEKKAQAAIENASA